MDLSANKEERAPRSLQTQFSIKISLKDIRLYSSYGRNIQLNSEYWTLMSNISRPWTTTVYFKLGLSARKCSIWKYVRNVGFCLYKGPNSNIYLWTSLTKAWTSWMMCSWPSWLALEPGVGGLDWIEGRMPLAGEDGEPLLKWRDRLERRVL